ncbi:MAG TPA: Tad domain-containing protein, partial [Candidatus Ozemobacteraceae bacterium]|nr:Tad domain-containing protein [Candidatus Ozemobacteraceae bacterium]
FILGMLALVTDVGWLYYQKARLQSAVNASWKAGFDEMAYAGAAANKTVIEARIRNIFQMNGYTAQQAADPFLKITYPNGGLSVYASETFPLFFARVLGRVSGDVVAERSGNGGTGCVPLGVMYGDFFYGEAVRNKKLEEGYEYTPFSSGSAGYTPGREYLLRIGQKFDGTLATETPEWYSAFVFETGASNQGSLRFGTDSGLPRWNYGMQYGYPGILNVGYICNPETGNWDNHSNTWRAFRSTANNNNRVIVPIITVIDKTTGLPNPNLPIYNYNGQTDIKIIGFAEFEILQPGESTAANLGDYVDGQIRGRFIDYIVKPS